MLRKVVVIDGNNAFYRFFFACKAKGSSNYLEFSLEKLCALKEIYHDSRMVFSFDTCKSERRLKLYPEYKGTRKSSLNEQEKQVLEETLNKFIEIVKNSGCIVMDGFGYEADDYIATFCQMTKMKHEVIVVSTDKDLYQLVEKYIGIYDPLKGVIVTSDNFKNITEIEQKYFLDYKCMIGDDSDNIHGIVGIGEKTAKKLITEYGNFESIVSGLTLKTKLTEREKAVINNDEIYKRNKQLMDLSINYSDSKLKSLIKTFANSPKLDKEKILKILAEHDITDLYEKVLKLCLRDS